VEIADTSYAPVASPTDEPPAPLAAQLITGAGDKAAAVEQCMNVYYI